MHAFYRHLPLLLDVLRRPELTFKTPLDVGDMVIVNHHRVMHGREEFLSYPGQPRNLVGCYAEMDEACMDHRNAEPALAV